MAKETERQCADELAELSDWQMLKTWQPPALTTPPPETTYALPPNGVRQKLISDHSCSRRAARAVESCSQVAYKEGVGYNSSCPIYLVDFDDGEEVSGRHPADTQDADAPTAPCHCPPPRLPLP